MLGDCLSEVDNGYSVVWKESTTKTPKYVETESTGCTASGKAGALCFSYGATSPLDGVGPPHGSWRKGRVKLDLGYERAEWTRLFPISHRHKWIRIDGTDGQAISLLIVTGRSNCS